MSTDIRQAIGPAGTAPEGYQAVTPFVVVKGAAELIEFTKSAFGAEELARVGRNGAIGHAEVKIGDAIVMMFDSRPDWPITPSFLRLYVADCDTVYRQALAAGGESVTEPTTMFWGDRVSRVRDPLGNLWWIQTRVEELDEAEMARRAGEPEYIEALNYVEGAEFFPGDKG